MTTWPVRTLLFPRPYQIAKRLLDLGLCLLSLPFILFVMAACALLVRLDSPGPILFVQERIGRGGRRFRIYKFRTMQHKLDDSSHRVFMQAFVSGQIGAQANQSNYRPNQVRAFIKTFIAPNPTPATDTVYKPAQASQITRIGLLLRKTSLDELPQILNVLKGEMSIVGPRPNVPWEVEAYQLWHHERLEVLPGITGLAQVKGRSGIDFDSIVSYDIDYIERQSLWLDIQILWWTVASVLHSRGAK